MKNIIVLIIIITCFTFCKKKKETVSTPTSNTPINTTLQNGLGNYVNSLHGVLQVQKFTIPSFSTTSFESRAAFSANYQPYSFYYMMGGIFATTGVYGGSLMLNSTTLKYDISTPNQTNRYVDTVSTRNYSVGATWDLSANASFSSFTSNITRWFPLITNQNYLPNSISKSSGLLINFGTNNYSNTDSLIVFIVGGTGATSYPIKSISGNATSLSFTPSELSGIGSGSGQIIVYGINFSNMTVNSKNYLFIMQYDIINFVTINP